VAVAATGCAAAPRAVRAPEREEARFTWESDVVLVHVDEAAGARRLVLQPGGHEVTLIEGQYLPRLELVELGDGPPEELWVATATGAHGNRVDALFAWNGGAPERTLTVATDEGDLALRDLDGDGRLEVVGEVSVWFDGVAWDFVRPLVLRFEAGRWLDVTREHPERLRAMRAASQVTPPTWCTAANAIEVLGLSLLLGEEGAGARWIEEHCQGAAPWLHEQRAALRAHVARPVHR
jgi:hypothetical protein